MFNKRGFTLIEILVVLLIVGITVSFTVLMLGDFGENRRIVVAAEQFTNYVKLMQQQAMLEANTLGIRIHQNTYQVLRYTQSNTWTPLSGNTLFRVQLFPKQTVINLDKSLGKAANPAIVITASGEISYFKLTLGTSQHPVLATVFSEHNRILLTRAKSS